MEGLNPTFFLLGILVETFGSLYFGIQDILLDGKETLQNGI
jgi:hypothetical protein